MLRATGENSLTEKLGILEWLTEKYFTMFAGMSLKYVTLLKVSVSPLPPPFKAINFSCGFRGSSWLCLVGRVGWGQSGQGLPGPHAWPSPKGGFPRPQLRKPTDAGEDVN